MIKLIIFFSFFINKNLYSQEFNNEIINNTIIGFSNQLDGTQKINLILQALDNSPLEKDGNKYLFITDRKDIPESSYYIDDNFYGLPILVKNNKKNVIIKIQIN